MDGFGCLGGLGRCGCLVARGDEVKDAVEGEDIEDEQQHDADGVEDGVAADEVVDDIVGRAVAADQEHIVIVEKGVGDRRGDAEEEKNAEGDGDVLLFHACHTRDGDIERGKARDGVRDARDDVVKAEHGIGRVIVARGVGAKQRAEDAEDKDEVKRRLLEGAFLRKGGNGERDQLDRAKEKRKRIQKVPRVARAEAAKDDLEQLKRIH